MRLGGRLTRMQAPGGAEPTGGQFGARKQRHYPPECELSRGPASPTAGRPTAGRPTAPALSRRRELGEASARSLLMTVLGEYVLPRTHTVWTFTLVRVLALLGVEEKSARQALARSSAEGWVASHRHGRRVRWQLTEPGRRMLSEGASRIYSFGRAQRRWDQRWLILLVSVPDTKRDLRHRLRTRLSWAGFGTPSPGVWVSPDPSREDEAHEILAELGLASASMSFLASYGTIGGQESVAQLAWDLDGVARRYQEFIDSFGGRRPAAGEDLLIAQTLLVHEWRRFPFLDPQLPAELLPASWIGAAAAQMFHARHAQWRDGAQRHWDTLLREDRLSTDTRTLPRVL
jgi:phenylacetic acid degradation operon negative regulatory protein